MAKPGPLSSVPHFSTNDIKRGVDTVLEFFEPNRARRDSLARAFRIELTRETTHVQTTVEDRQILKRLIMKNGADIIEILTRSTCLRIMEEPQKTAEVIYTEIAKKFKSI